MNKEGCANMMNSKSTIKMIYDHLQDKESKTVFANRLLYSLTEDSAYMDQIVKTLYSRTGMGEIIDFCREHLDETVVYGAGNDLSILVNLYSDFRFKYICDGDAEKQKRGWNGFPVMSPEELIKKKENVYVIIISSHYNEEILHFLLNSGFAKERIINLGGRIEQMHEEQYFDREIITPCPEETFIDGGCYECDTDKLFITWCSGNYKKIIAFEPDEENYRKCLEVRKKENIAKLDIYPKGLWDCETELFFSGDRGVGSQIGEGAEAVRIFTATIDETVGDDEVTFIKLDVEGAELKALKGARKTIQKYRPKLAVCIYHKPEDVIEIPEYILSLHKDYKLYIRHYLLTRYETVLYAL